MSVALFSFAIHSHTTLFLKPILIYAKLYVLCALKDEYYLYLCNATNHPKNAFNVAFLP